jgi:hypothetical protein
MLVLPHLLPHQRRGVLRKRRHSELVSTRLQKQRGCAGKEGRNCSSESVASNGIEPPFKTTTHPESIPLVAEGEIVKEGKEITQDEVNKEEFAALEEAVSQKTSHSK